MKKIVLLLMGILVSLSLFAVSGTPVKAAEDDCGCVVEPITGVERNKMVSNLISSSQFKTVKAEQEKNGYSWAGADSIEIINNLTYQVIMVGVPFVNAFGEYNYIVYFYEDGTFIKGEIPTGE